MSDIDCYFIKKSYSGPDDECGDTGVIKIEKQNCFIAHIDALGHGPKAAEVAVIAKNYLEENYTGDLIKIMESLHSHLIGTRGVVAAICRVDLNTGIVEHVGIGNITARIYGLRHRSFVSRDGVIGFSLTTPKIHNMTMSPGDLLILSSDGIKEHFILEDYPGLLKGSSKQIANNMMINLGKNDDDVSCTVLRY